MSQAGELLQSSRSNRVAGVLRHAAVDSGVRWFKSRQLKASDAQMRTSALLALGLAAFRSLPEKYLARKHPYYTAAASI